MTVTPWGQADELRARRLRPGPGASRDEVRNNQRERLFGAMVAAVAEKGYDRTRVADLLEISGVSRNTFYRHFENKHDCFLATVDALVEAAGKIVTATFEGFDGSERERLSKGLETLISLIVEHPAAAQLYYVETYAAGAEAIAKVDRVGDAFERMTADLLADAPRYAGMPRDLLRAVLRGFRRIIQTRLRTGRVRDLLHEGPELLEWALGYETPPEPLLRHADPPPYDFEAPFDMKDSRERILAAVIELMGERGYGELKITDIARRASISLTTFYANFDSKDEAVIAALRRGANRVIEATAPIYREAPDWPHAVGAGIHAFFAFLVLERPFAQFGGVDAHSGSPLVIEVREQMLAAAQAFLSEGYRQYPHVGPIIGEAIGASIDAMLFDQLALRERADLYALAPTATYLALVPFVGVQQACAIANSSR